MSSLTLSAYISNFCSEYCWFWFWAFTQPLHLSLIFAPFPFLYLLSVFVIDLWIIIAFWRTTDFLHAVMWYLMISHLWLNILAIIGKREICRNMKIRILKSVFLPTLLYRSESWTMRGRLVNRITTSEIKYLKKVSARHDKMKSGTRRLQRGCPLGPRVEEMRLSRKR